LRAAGIDVADRVSSLVASGHMTEVYLFGLIPQIRADRVEIYAHPAVAAKGEPTNGPPGAGQAELEALLSGRVRNALAVHGFELTNDNDLGVMGPP
jgi:hypothetical protein